MTVVRPTPVGATPRRGSPRRSAAWSARAASVRVRLRKPGPATSTAAITPEVVSGSAPSASSLPSAPSVAPSSEADASARAGSSTAATRVASSRGFPFTALASGSTPFAWKSAWSEGRISGSAPRAASPSTAVSAARTSSARISDSALAMGFLAARTGLPAFTWGLSSLSSRR